MSAALKARVQHGRLVLDEPTDLPEGSEVSLSEDNNADLVAYLIKKMWDEGTLEQRMGLYDAIRDNGGLSHRQRKRVSEVVTAEQRLELYRFLAETSARPDADPAAEGASDEELEELDRALQEGLEEADVGQMLSPKQVLENMKRARREALASG